MSSKKLYLGLVIYDSSTDMVLLEQKEPSLPWSLPQVEGVGKHTPQEMLQEHLEKNFKLKFKPTEILEVYDYFSRKYHANYFVFYVVVAKTPRTVPSNANWFNFKQISKLNRDEFTKQDLTVAQRVLNNANQTSSSDDFE